MFARYVFVAATLLSAASCGQTSPGEVIVRTLENAARAACAAAESCSNQCSGGSRVERQRYDCEQESVTRPPTRW